MVWLIVVGTWALLAPVVGIPLGLAIGRADSTEQPLPARATGATGPAVDQPAVPEPDVSTPAVAEASAAASG